MITRGFSSESHLLFFKIISIDYTVRMIDLPDSSSQVLVSQASVAKSGSPILNRKKRKKKTQENKVSCPPVRTRTPQRCSHLDRSQLSVIPVAGDPMPSFIHTCRQAKQQCIWIKRNKTLKKGTNATEVLSLIYINL